MSASLVGSEMCIRDSFVAPLFVPRSCRPALTGERPTERERAREQGTAVSYTHLTLPTICSV
eukprot:6665274-Alexandrium_andersonii.AAC.1